MKARLLAVYLLALCIAGWAAPLHAADAGFTIRVTLNGAEPASGFGLQPRGTCISESLSSQTRATVRVVCGTSQFVSIEAVPGRPFVGTHGGAFRYFFDPNSATPATASGLSNLFVGTGTVTGLRFIDISGLESFLEILVSF